MYEEKLAHHGDKRTLSSRSTGQVTSGFIEVLEVWAETGVNNEYEQTGFNNQYEHSSENDDEKIIWKKSQI